MGGLYCTVLYCAALLSGVRVTEMEVGLVDELSGLKIADGRCWGMWVGFL